MPLSDPELEECPFRCSCSLSVSNLEHFWKFRPSDDSVVLTGFVEEEDSCNDGDSGNRDDEVSSSWVFPPLIKPHSRRAHGDRV